MRLENLIADIDEEMYSKIVENRSVKDKDAKETAKIVGLSAIKYGDLSNQATKDYIFDVDRFTSFEGNTGPYILYTIVRIKSILNRYVQEGGDLSAGKILPAFNASEKNLMLQLSGFAAMVENAFEEKAPHKICAYIYEVSNAFNSFYHETKILSEEDQAQKESFLQHRHHNNISIKKRMFCSRTYTEHPGNHIYCPSQHQNSRSKSRRKDHPYPISFFSYLLRKQTPRHFHSC